jgi:hypothetical protein
MTPPLPGTRIATTASDDNVEAVACRAYLRQSLSAMWAGQFATSRAAAEQANALAVRLRDRAAELMSVHRLAMVAVRGGDWTAAEQLFETAIAGARELDTPDILVPMLIDFCTVVESQAALSADPLAGYTRAIAVLYEVISRWTPSLPEDRRPIPLTNLGIILGELGYYPAAQLALSLALGMPGRPNLRQHAAIALLSIAARTGERVTFDRRVRQLDREALPPYLQVAFLWDMGVGLVCFDERERGLELLAAAEGLALHYGTTGLQPRIAHDREMFAQGNDEAVLRRVATGARDGRHATHDARDAGVETLDPAQPDAREHTSVTKPDAGLSDLVRRVTIQLRGWQQYALAV